jgi:hypothetical protein
MVSFNIHISHEYVTIGIITKCIFYFNILYYSSIASTCWTWWWPSSRPKHVVLLTTLLTDNKLVVFLTSLHCTFMLHTQWGCLRSRLDTELYIHVTVHRNRFLLNNQPDALIIQKFILL